MARKDDILSIYTKEVEGIKEAGLFKGEAPFVSPQGARVRMEDGRELLCMCANNYLGLGDHPRLIEAAKKTYDEKGYGVAFALSAARRTSIRNWRKRSRNFLERMIRFCIPLVLTLTEGCLRRY